MLRERKPDPRPPSFRKHGPRAPASIPDLSSSSCSSPEGGHQSLYGIISKHIPFSDSFTVVYGWPAQLGRLCCLWASPWSLALYQTNKLEAPEVPKNPGSPPTPCILVSPRSFISLCEAGHSFISLGYPVPFKTETLLARCSRRKMKRKGKGKRSARTKLESDPCLGNASRAVFRVFFLCSPPGTPSCRVAQPRLLGRDRKCHLGGHNAREGPQQRS